MSVDRRSDVPTDASGTSSPLPPGFTDQVMRAIGRAPRPSPVRAFRSAVQDRSVAEARGALSVAWRLVRRSTSMPVMVRAQALALVVLVAGSMLGGGVLAAVVAYQTVGPIVQAISEPIEDRARTIQEAPPTSPPPAALEPPLATPTPAAPAEAPATAPDRTPAVPATTGGAIGPADDRDDADDDDDADATESGDKDAAEEPDGDAHEDADGEADRDGADEPAEAEDPDAADPDEADDPEGAVETGGSDEADESADDPDSGEPDDPSEGGESDEVEPADGSGGG